MPPSPSSVHAATVAEAAGAEAARATLLAENAGRSDDPPSQPSTVEEYLGETVSVLVETLIPLRSYYFEMRLGESVGSLRKRFLRARAADSLAGTPQGPVQSHDAVVSDDTLVNIVVVNHNRAGSHGALPRTDMAAWLGLGPHESRWRLLHDGVDLPAADTATLEQCNLTLTRLPGRPTHATDTDQARAPTAAATAAGGAAVAGGSEADYAMAAAAMADQPEGVESKDGANDDSEGGAGDTGGARTSGATGAGSAGDAKTDEGGVALDEIGEGSERLGLRLVAIEHRWRGGLLGYVQRWSPLLLASCIALSLLGFGMDGAAGAHHADVCDRPLRAFVAVGALLLVPYGLVLSGTTQAERGHRLLWVWPYPWLLRLVATSMAASLVALALGGAWAFSVDSTCRETAPRLHASAVALWALLLLANLPVLLCVLLPCLLLCRLPFAFEVVAFMGGRHRTEASFDFPSGGGGTGGTKSLGSMRAGPGARHQKLVVDLQRGCSASVAYV